VEQYGLKIKGLSKAFPANGSGKVHALQGFDLDIDPGSFLVIVGPNGSGKTTLLNLLAGDLDPDDGEIKMINSAGQVDWLQTPRWKRAIYLARVHQDPKKGTAPGMTVWENFRLASNKDMAPSPFRFSSASHSRDWFQKRLEAIGLGDKIDSRAADLSQGQRQLLAVELALSRDPSFLLLDEHTASLDQKNAIACLETTVKLSGEKGTTVLMVTHNLLDALKYGNRLIVMREGRVHRDFNSHEKEALGINDLLELCGFIT